jgi:hypothetical protein
MTTSDSPTPEEHLSSAAAFLDTNGIEAVLVDGKRDNGEFYEGIGFIARDGADLGEVTFVDGRPEAIDTDMLAKRLRVQGFVNEVVRPVQKAYSAIYEDGDGLLDERFDILGMD